MSNEQLKVGQIYKTDDNVMFVVRDKPPGVMKISDELFAVKIEDDVQLVSERLLALKQIIISNLYDHPGDLPEGLQRILDAANQP